MINENQCTIVRFVDDKKVSHMNDSGSSSLFTTYVDSWLDTVLLEKAGILTVSLLVNPETLIPS